MILKFVKPFNGSNVVLLDNVSGLEYSTILHEAPIEEDNLTEDVSEHIQFSENQIPKTVNRFIKLGLEINEARRKNKKVFFRILNYVDRVANEQVLVAYDEYSVYICNDRGKTIDRT